MPTSFESRCGGARGKCAHDTHGRAACQPSAGCYTGARGGCDATHAEAAARRRDRRRLHPVRPRRPSRRRRGRSQSRIGMAAVHVVADPLAAINPTLEVALDWDATLRFRHYLWSLGLAVAEAMDTSQRGMGFDWTTAKELIKRSVAESKTVPGAVLASGAGTDHLEPGPRVTIADVEAAYEEQCAWIEGCGGRIILMASRALAAVRQEPRRLREGLRPHPEPGARAGHRALARRDVRPRAGGLLGLARPRSAGGDTAGHRQRARGQDRRREDLAAGPGARDRDAEAVSRSGAHVHRRRLRLSDDDPRRRRSGHSDALLGIFDVIAPAASAALKALDRGRPRDVRDDPGADADAVAPRLRRSHALLQDRGGLRRLPQRPPVALPDGGRDGERALGRAPGRAVQADGRARDCCAIPRWRPRACAAC